VVDPAAPRRSTWWLLFALLTAGCLAWSVATPLMASPDEGAHAVRAAGVVRGQLTPRRAPGEVIESWIQRVPEAYRDAPGVLCFVVPSTEHAPAAQRTPACIPKFRGTSHLVDATTYEFRGTPHVYWVLGLPSLVIPDRWGMILMRTMNVVACAALLASACTSALHRSRRRLAIAGVLLAATPMTWYLAGTVNPNGTEIAAAIALWATVLPLALADSSESDGRLVTRAGVALALLVAIRGLGGGFAAVALVVGILLAAPDRRRAIARRRDARVWALVAAGSLALTVAWVLAVGTDLHQVPHATIGLVGAVERLPVILRQSVGAFGTSYLPLPLWVIALWSATALGGVVLAGVRGSGRVRLLLALVAFGTLLLPVTTDGFNLPNIGFPWQGRYGLPLTVGLVILAFGVVDTSRRAMRTAGVAATVAALVVQVAAFVAIGRRLGMGTVRGNDVLDYVLDPRWEPPWPAAVLLVLMLVAVIGIGVVALRPMRRSCRASVSADAPRTARAGVG
jgi:hypothetical protein